MSLYKIVVHGLLIFAVTLSSVSLAQSQQEQITIVADEWCPYNCVPGAVLPGYAIEMIRVIFAKHDIAVKYVIAPWTESIRAAKAGDHNAVLGAAKSKMPNGIFPQQELGYYSNDFIVSKNSSWRFTGVDSLQSVNLGVIRDYVYGPELDSYVWGPKNLKVQALVGENASEVNVRKVIRGEIDVYLEDGNVAFYEARIMGLDKHLKHVDSEGTKTPFYLVFSPAFVSSKKHAKTLSLGIKELRKSGELDYILSKYGLKDWK
ncbi:MAG: polar amino acid transport system substrate-binding protein [Crocinitomicaceae bacterium]